MFRDLQDVHSFAPLQSQQLIKNRQNVCCFFSTKFVKKIICDSSSISPFFEQILMKFGKNLTKFREISNQGYYQSVISRQFSFIFGQDLIILKYQYIEKTWYFGDILYSYINWIPSLRPSLTSSEGIAPPLQGHWPVGTKVLYESSTSPAASSCEKCSAVRSSVLLHARGMWITDYLLWEDFRET